MRRVFEWFNSGIYDDQKNYILFGRNDVYEIIEELTGDSEHDPNVEILERLKSHLRVQSGREEAADRVSLHGKPKVEPFEDLDKLSPDAIYLLWQRSKQPSAHSSAAQLLPSDVADRLDAKYANELIEKLEKIVERVTLLNPHEVDASRIRNTRLKVCFEEAHRCYLYGFNRACAVMCRALLESALKDKYDPDHKIENNLTKGQSLFKELLKRAALVDPLPKRAEGVKICGDWAAHNDPRFEGECESQGAIRDNLIWTRAILAALYPVSG